MKNGTVAAGNSEMPYVSFGIGKKSLVVLPGLSDGLATVKGKALFLMPSYRRFLRNYTVYIFSRKNDMPEGYSIRDMAEDQVLAMRKLGLEKVYLLGVSQGGMIAQYLAIDHPEMVEKLILAFTAPNANPVVKEAICGWIDMANRRDHCALMTDTAEKMYSDDYLRKNRKFFPLLARFTKPRDYGRFFRNASAILEFDCRSELAGIGAPTLIIAGGDDRTVGNAAAGELKEAIRNSEMFVYERLGHGAYEEAGDFYDRVLEFCDL